MSSTHKVPKKITAILAIVFLLPALYIFALWMNVYKQDISQAQKVDEFIKHFHPVINDSRVVMYLSMAFCLTAIVLAAKSFKQPSVPLRIAMWLTVMIASLIFFMNIFQLL